MTVPPAETALGRMLARACDPNLTPAERAQAETDFDETRAFFAEVQERSRALARSHALKAIRRPIRQKGTTR